MKHQILTAALLAVGVASASAQSTVTIYGVMDAGLLAGKFSANNTQRNVSTNTITASKIGFTGSEDLGGGLRANFLFEHGIRGHDSFLPVRLPCSNLHIRLATIRYPLQPGFLP